MAGIDTGSSYTKELLRRAGAVSVFGAAPASGAGPRALAGGVNPGTAGGRRWGIGGAAAPAPPHVIVWLT